MIVTEHMKCTYCGHEFEIECHYTPELIMTRCGKCAGTAFRKK